MEEEKTKPVLISALAACTTRDLLDDTFFRYNANDLEFCIECMNECMGNPKTFFSQGEEISVDDRYELTVQMFLIGAWKTARINSERNGC